MKDKRNQKNNTQPQALYQRDAFFWNYILLLGFLFCKVSAFASPSNGSLDEQIPARLLVALSYGFIWAVVLIFVILLANRLRKLQKKMKEIEVLVGQRTMSPVNHTSSTDAKE